MINQVVTYDNKGFIINGNREFLIGGEFHYFRVPAAEWEDRLKKMKSMGANLIAVYIAWNMHEPQEGKERWDGDYDLDRFLRLCKKYGFYVLIKPGPYICAELDFGGHPDWLIAKVAKKEFRLRMLDEGYLRLCKRWYKTVSEKINRHLITNGGPIIAAQIENEYDHLIEYGEEAITVQDAIDYLMYLKDAMEECGIDVPKFANEATFLRGRGVIDTRTYYPNIPGLWMWEFGLYENKIVESRKAQSDTPVMILELQAGWFSQIGAPTYEPCLNVIKGVSKSVLIQGASIINYYMMVGGTSFPFMGARGDVVFSGGLGNITSYDFGGAPVGENGGLHREKYYWIKGFIRFAKQFCDIILSGDEKSYVSVAAGGEDVALLAPHGAELDYAVDRCCENFSVCEKGNEDGRFFFIRNLEDECKDLTLRISEELLGRETTFQVSVDAKETLMLPVGFRVPGTGLRINYGTSEILLSKKYGSGTALAVYGRKGTPGELCLNVRAEELKAVKGKFDVYNCEGGCVLRYRHGDIQIVSIMDVTLFIIGEDRIGGVEELNSGLLFHNLYYLVSAREEAGGIRLDAQLKENADYSICFFPMAESAAVKDITLDGETLPLQKKQGAYTAAFRTGTFGGGPEFQWTSDWKYMPDTAEIAADYDYSKWTCLEKPVSLEEAGFITHGYYWYKTSFELEEDPGMVFMDYEHNDTDRMFIYINGELVYKSHNRKIRMNDVTRALKRGMNDMTILYANEFHNKSHPHEGAIVKYSGIMHPFMLHGTYSGGRELKLEIASFYLKQGLAGMNGGCHTLDYDDGGWNAAPRAKKFVAAKELGHVVWLRRTFRYSKNEKLSAPLRFSTKRADQRLTVYVNGRAVARYDILGPQQEFHIPESFIDRDGENVIAIILECPAFYDELQSGYRRGYLYNPVLEPAYIAESCHIDIDFNNEIL